MTNSAYNSKSYYEEHGKQNLEIISTAYFNRELESDAAKKEIYEMLNGGAHKHHVKGTKWIKDHQQKKIKTKEELDKAILTYAKHSGLDADNFKGGEYELIEHIEDTHGIDYHALLKDAETGNLTYKKLTTAVDKGRGQRLSEKARIAASSAVTTAEDIHDLLKDETIKPYIPADFDKTKFGVTDGVKLALYKALDPDGISDVLKDFIKSDKK